MILISVFNGASIAQLAVTKAIAKPIAVYTSEVDKHALKHESVKFPNNIQLGDIRNIDGYELKAHLESVYPGRKIMFVGGSPCQNLSFAGTRKGMSTTCSIRIKSLSQYLQLVKEGFEFKGYSYLFWEWVRLREEIQPDYWFLENVQMNKVERKTFNKAVGVEGVLIDSALVSGQRRKRLYWANWAFSEPKDRNVLFGSVLDVNEPFRALSRWVFKKWGDKRKIDKLESVLSPKSPTLTTSRTHGNMYILNEDKTMYRNLNVSEYERLQCFPTDWTDGAGLKQTNRIKMIGNAWNLESVADIFSQLR